jgi:S-adenosylmethionine:tRNA ribosyltransferase-isomerase
MIPSIDIADYNYDLPEDRIAKYPLGRRDASQLLLYDRGRISSRNFRDLPDLAGQNTLMVFNDTRVIQARLKFEKDSGSKIEVFCLEPRDPADYNLAFQKTSGALWKCLVGNARKWKDGYLQMDIPTGGGSVSLRAEKTGREKDAFLVRFEWEPSGIPFGEILEQAGKTPIPPYLNREAEQGDRGTYQTVYSRLDGSVAAPTAGLHFTPSVLKDISSRGIPRIDLTLHVGAGTFQPVIARELGSHPMHAENFSVTLDSIEKLYSHKGDILAVGTTSTRVLESLYWLGVRLGERDRDKGPDSSGADTLPAGTEMPGRLFLDQWEAYSLPKPDRKESMENLLGYMDRWGLDSVEGLTRLMIVPGYEYRMVSRLLTNYHQPKSTLLLLVAALIGEDWRKVYDYALARGFRFLSYGDSSLLIPR